MNITTFPLDATTYTADALGAWFAVRTRGVFAADGHYHITTNNTMSVTVGSGLAWLRMTEHWGVVAFNQNPVALTLPPAENATHRIDAVCLQLDKSANLSRLILKKGTSGENTPAPPVRNASLDEIYLATIRVPAGAASVQPNHITDQRLNETYCGIVSDGAQIPTQQLYDTWMAWFAEVRRNLDDDAAGHLYNLIEGLREDVGALRGDMNTHITQTIAAHGATTAPTANTLAARGAGGTLRVGVPTADDHAVRRLDLNNGLRKAGPSPFQRIIMTGRFW